MRLITEDIDVRRPEMGSMARYEADRVEADSDATAVAAAVLLALLVAAAFI